MNVLCNPAAASVFHLCCSGLYIGRLLLVIIKSGVMEPMIGTSKKNIDTEALGLQGVAGYSKCKAVLMATLYFVLLSFFLLIMER